MHETAKVCLALGRFYPAWKGKSRDNLRVNDDEGVSDAG
jgi:hypothetical protein